MKILRELAPSFLNSKDLSALPDEMVKQIKKLIKSGAEDLQQDWANALALVHSAYDQTGTEYPNPDMKSAWKQYEENISYSVEQLAKYRGLTGNWRMSSSVFESEQLTTFKIRHIHGDRVSETVSVEAKDINHLAEIMEKEERRKNVEVKIKHNKNNYHITFWKHNTKLPGYLEVTPVY